jgi:MFS family permease
MPSGSLSGPVARPRAAGPPPPDEKNQMHSPEREHGSRDTVPRFDSGSKRLLAVLAGCQFIAVTSLLVVLPLLDQIGASLHESGSGLGWVVIAGAIVGAIGNGIFPSLGSLIGQRAVMAGSMGLLALGSAISALAPDAGVFLLGRILSSFGIAAVVVSVAIVRELFSGTAVIRALGLLAVIDGPANGAGFALGGVVQEVLHVDWRAVFAAIAVIAVLMTVAAVAVVPGGRQRAADRIDVPGGLLLAGALVVLLLPVTDGAVWGWSSWRVIGLLLGGITLAAIWIGVELRTRQPMIQLRVLSRRGVTSGCLLFALLGGTLTVINLTVPGLLEAPRSAGGFGASVLGAGLSMLPFCAAMIPAAYVSSRLLRRYPPRLIVAVSLAVEVTALGLLSVAHGSASEVVLLSALFGIGHGGLLASVYALVVRGARTGEAGTSAGLGGVGSSAAGAIMAAVITAVLARADIFVGHAQVPGSAGYAHAWLLGAGLAAGAMAVVLLTARGRRQAAEGSRLRHYDAVAAVARARLSWVLEVMPSFAKILCK